jgi:hypothetical protein
MEDSSGLADLCRDLTQIEFVWLLGWNIADGRWSRIGLEQLSARHFLLDLFSKLHDDPLGGAKSSCRRLQQRLMALHRGTFEEIQQESPFSRLAQRNMDGLLRAWMDDREAGYARAWEQVFQPGWEAALESQEPIQIIGDVGDCEERALEVIGAPDRQTRVAAESWYLYHTFGGNWTPGMHFTTSAHESAARFSVHNITVLPDSQKQVYFRLPW